MKTPLPIRQTIDAKSHTLLHTSVDIRWLLQRSTTGQLADAVTVNHERASGHDVRALLLNLLAEGHALLPIGTPCEGWDPITGCPGHHIDSDNGRQNAEVGGDQAEADHDERADGARDP